MLMEYELNVKVNEIIADLVREAYEKYNFIIDMIVSQADKYENTEYETIVYGLGMSQGMRKDKYYFNAVKEDDNPIISKYYGEPVSYYENNGTGCMLYRVTVSPMSKVVIVHSVGLVGNEPTYSTIAKYNFGTSKFAKKVA